MNVLGEIRQKHFTQTDLQPTSYKCFGKKKNFSRIDAYKANKRGKEKRLEPMSLDDFYGRIEKSDKAFQNGDIITQDELREEIKRWRVT
jgi:hypothetical protein